MQNNLFDSNSSLTRIIVDHLHDHWSAWFEGNPKTAFGGDSPGTAVDRLWESWLRQTSRADRLDSPDCRFLFMIMPTIANKFEEDFQGAWAQNTPQYQPD